MAKITSELNYIKDRSSSIYREENGVVSKSRVVRLGSYPRSSTKQIRIDTFKVFGDTYIKNHDAHSEVLMLSFDGKKTRHDLYIRDLKKLHVEKHDMLNKPTSDILLLSIQHPTLSLVSQDTIDYMLRMWNLIEKGNDTGRRN